MLQQGDVQGAISYFRTVTKLKPTLPVAHAYLAQALESNGQMDEAIAEFRVAVQLAPKQPEAHRAVGRALSAQQKTDEAIEEFKEAVRLAPEQAERHDELGSLSAQKSQFTDAEEEFRHAIKIDAKYEPATAVKHWKYKTQTKACVRMNAPLASSLIYRSYKRASEPCYSGVAIPNVP
jgi:Tfp pilus assembly protein PilF